MLQKLYAITPHSYPFVNTLTANSPTIKIKHRVKKLAAFISIILEFYFLPFIPTVYAQNLCPQGYENLCKIDIGNKPNIFGTVIQIILVFAVVLSVAFLIWGGIKWISSGGDKGKIDQARSAIIASIIGLVISLLAWFIISIIMYMFTGNGDMNLPIPKLV